MGVPWMTTLMTGLVIAWCVMDWKDAGEPGSLFIAGWATGLLMAVWAVWLLKRWE